MTPLSQKSFSEPFTHKEFQETQAAGEMRRGVKFFGRLGFLDINL